MLTPCALNLITYGKELRKKGRKGNSAQGYHIHMEVNTQNGGGGRVALHISSFTMKNREKGAEKLATKQPNNQPINQPTNQTKNNLTKKQENTKKKQSGKTHY